MSFLQFKKISRQRYAVIIVVILSIIIVYYKPKPQKANLTIHDHWRSTELHFSIFDRVLPFCKTNPNGCARALQTSQLFLKSTASSFADIQKIISNSADQALITGIALNSWINELDPHGGFLPRAFVRDFEQSSQSKDPSYSIGIQFRKVNQNCIITSVVPGSAAALAGIVAGDEITLLAGLPCQLNTSFQLTDRLQELTKSQTKISLQFKNRSPATLQPLPTSLQNIETKMIGNSAVIRVKNFYQNQTCVQLKATLLKSSHNSKAIILDLRNNPGGYIEEASCVAGLFLGEGVSLANFYRLSPLPLAQLNEDFFKLSEKELSALYRSNFSLLTNEPQSTALPLVVLINHATASSAEILAGALQDYGRAWIVGNRSFGKGTMQTSVMPESWPKLQLTQTTHRIVLPMGAELQVYGVRPHFSAKEPASPLPPREYTLFPNSLSPQNALPHRVKKMPEIAINSCIYKKNYNHQSTDALALAQQVIDCDLATRKH